MPKTNFVNGDPSQGIMGTIVTAEFLNAVNNHLHTGLDRDGDGALAYAVTGGTGNNYTLSIPMLPQYVEGMPIYFKANRNNTGPATLNINGFGSIAIKKISANTLSDLGANDIIANVIYQVIYTGSEFLINTANINADTLDSFHASQTPTANTIPVSSGDKKLSEGWTKFGFETYSSMSVGTSLPSSPNHNDLFWNSSTLKLYKYDARTTTWTEINWQDIVKASPEWQAGRLRINSSTGKLEISPDGTNWYECIPAVGANAIGLATIDNTGYTYKYWIAPGQTVIIRSANHVPIVYAKDVVPFFSASYFNSFSYEYIIGLRPNNISISDGDACCVAYGGSNRFTNLSFVPITEQGGASSWANFELRIMTNNRFYINSMGQGYAGYTLVLFNCSGTASSTSYWLGTWYAQDGTQFTMNYLTLTRRA